MTSTSSQPALFATTMRALANVSNAELADPWQWSGHSGGQLQKRDALYLSLQDEYSSFIQAPAAVMQSEKILGLADEALGELQGLLTGVPDDILDVPPASGEWSLREVLEHLLIERRYAQQTAYALRRSDEDPLYKSLRVELLASDRDGGINAWVARLEAARTDTYAVCSGPDVDLTPPTRWAGYDVDVRFRLHRFATHLAEHTVQAEKTLAVVGPSLGEAARIVRRIWRTRAAHQRRSPGHQLTILNAAHAARAASLGA